MFLWECGNEVFSEVAEHTVAHAHVKVRPTLLLLFSALEAQILVTERSCTAAVVAPLGLPAGAAAVLAGLAVLLYLRSAGAMMQLGPKLVTCGTAKVPAGSCACSGRQCCFGDT
jgi:hypothetical protein